MNTWITSFGRDYGLQVGVLVVIVASYALLVPSFAGDSAMYATLERFVPLGIAAAGIAVTMIAGEIDLSVGAVALTGGVVAVRLSEYGLVASILIATAMSILIGVAQGLVIGILRISSLVLTVGTSIFLGGIAWLLAGGGPVSVADFSTTDPLLLRIWAFTPVSLAAIAVLVALGVFLTWAKWGRELYAIGGARSEAIAAGVPLKRSMVVAFAISGGCGGLAGALSSMKSGSVTPDAFPGLLLSAIAATLIGGVSLWGGRGTMFNVVLGILIISVVGAGSSAMGMKAFVTALFTGALLLTVVVLEFLFDAVRRSRALRRLRTAVLEEASMGSLAIGLR